MESVAVRPIARPSSALLLSAASLACAVVVGFSALVRIPLPGTPVPVTLQTFALLACAGLLGRFYALQMVGWYAALGLAGAPFFTGGGGVAALAGPTGGYVAGFVAAAAIVGFAEGGRRSLLAQAAIYVAAALAIYVPGLLWLKISTASTWTTTVAMGLLPFAGTDFVKALAASSVARLCGR